jgi:putative ABC transport system ATP-binding protein
MFHIKSISRTRVNRRDDWRPGLPLRLLGARLRRGGVNVLDGIDLTFEPARSYVILGASGAGKSSLLRLLNRLDDPTEGSVLIGDDPLTDRPARTLRRKIGMVFQAPRGLPGSVAENLLYPFEIHGVARPPDVVLSDLLAEVGLDRSWLDRDVSALSGGERQRLALATALAADPEILCLDEPTSALDPAATRVVVELLANRATKNGLRTIVVTHQREHAARFGAIAVVLEKGRVADLGPTSEVLARTAPAAWDPTEPAERSDALQQFNY